MTELEEAILFHCKSLSLRPTTHPRSFFPLHNLVDALSQRFELTGLMTDLQEVFCCVVNLYPSVPHLMHIIPAYSINLQMRF